MNTTFLSVTVVDFILVALNILLTIVLLGPDTVAASMAEEETSTLFSHYLDCPFIGL